MTTTTRRSGVLRAVGALVLGLVSVVAVLAAWLWFAFADWGGEITDQHGWGWVVAGNVGAVALAAGSVWLAVVARGVPAWVRVLCALPGALVVGMYALLVVSELVTSIAA